MTNAKNMEDAAIRKSLVEYDNTNVQDAAGMFIVHYNPQISLEETTPSCQYPVNINKNDNIASVLRKNAKYIQEMLDDWFGVEESNQTQRIFVSHQEMIDDANAYCTVVYAGYESENEGEVSALVSDQISSVIDTTVPMEWNEVAYPVTDGQLEREQLAEELRKQMDVKYEISSPSVALHDTKNIALDESLCSESEMNKSNDFEKA